MRITTYLLGFAAIVLVPLACGGPQYGIGQGQPAYPERTGTGTAQTPLAITSVFVAKNPAQLAMNHAELGYVQLKNTGTAAIDFSQLSLSLVSSQASTPLTPDALAELQTPLQPNATLVLGDAALAAFAEQLPYPVGQVVIVDDTFTVQGYLAWGTAAPVTGAGAGAAPLPALTQQAIASQAIPTASSNFVTIPAQSTDPNTSVYLGPANAGGIAAP